jgi:hypothetical protein
MGAVGVFGVWQPAYAGHQIPTFPVTIKDGRKKPAVRGYLKATIDASNRFATNATFRKMDAIGFALGSRTGVTVLDIDAPDERILADALDRHGQSPIVVRSGSGNFHVWYRYNGERRSIRPCSDLPIDLLGSGYVVGPPSKASNGTYQFLMGSLEELDRLKPIGGLETLITQVPHNPIEVTREGNRNNGLYGHCMRHARRCDSFEALLDVAETLNMDFVPPLDPSEVAKVARSAWQCTERGLNRFGQPGVAFSAHETNLLIEESPDLFLLLGFLRANNGPSRTFYITNSLARTFGWSEKRLSAARSRLLGRYFVRVRAPSRNGGPALYRWIQR